MITLAYTLLGLFFIFLPFVPAVIEVLRSTDSQALKITNHILKDPRSSPELLYWHYAHLLGAEDMEALAKLATVQTSTLLMESILAVPEGRVPELPKTVSRVLSAGSIELSPRTAYFSKIVSLRSIKTGERNAINEIHAKERLTLGKQSKVMWWASAEEITVEESLDLPGKIQAVRSITFNGSARFHHLEAPVIRTDKEVPEEAVSFFVETGALPKRHSYVEHCEIKAGEIVEGDLIVKGNLILHENAKVHGNVKGHHVIILKPGAQISGNVVSLGNLNCEGKNWIGGSVLCQKTIFFADQCHVGSENQRVTVSGTNIEVNGAFRAHGTLRAWTAGSFA